MSAYKGYLIVEGDYENVWPYCWTKTYKKAKKAARKVYDERRPGPYRHDGIWILGMKADGSFDDLDTDLPGPECKASLGGPARFVVPTVQVAGDCVTFHSGAAAWVQT